MDVTGLLPFLALRHGLDPFLRRERDLTCVTLVLLQVRAEQLPLAMERLAQLPICALDIEAVCKVVLSHVWGSGAEESARFVAGANRLEPIDDVGLFLQLITTQTLLRCNSPSGGQVLQGLRFATALFQQGMPSLRLLEGILNSHVRCTCVHLLPAPPGPASCRLTADLTRPQEQCFLRGLQ